MYGYLWRRLPGSPPLRLGLALLLLAGAGSLLWYVVFPLVDAWLPLGEATLGQ